MPQVSHPVDLLGSYSAFMAQVKCPLYWEAFYHNGSLRAEPNPESVFDIGPPTIHTHSERALGKNGE